MAKIDIAGLAGYYDDDFARVLESTLKRVVPTRVFERENVLAAFLEAMGEQFAQWETLPSNYYIPD